MPFNPDEIAALEAENPALSGELTSPLIYESLAFVKNLGLTAGAASGLEREFRAVANWHDFRGRPERAAQFRRAADNFAVVLVENLTDKETN